MEYYNLNGKLPHITYEYTVPLPSLDATSTAGVEPDPVNSYGNLTFNEVNEHIREDQPLATNHSRGSTTVHPYNSQSHEEEDVEEVVWEIKTPSPPPSAAILLYRPADIYSHNDVEQPPVPSGYRKSMLKNSFWDSEGVLALLSNKYPLYIHKMLPNCYIYLYLTCYSVELGSSTNSVDEPSTADEEPVLLSFPGSDQIFM